MKIACKLMIRRAVFYIIFLFILLCNYVIFSLIYGNWLSDLPEIILYYSAITLFILGVNLIKMRKIKWLILLLINVVVLTIVILGADAPDVSSFYLLVVMSPLNMPLLPRLQFHVKNDIFRIVVY